jgi:Spy/CpxP family protein refolding chaperone
VQTNLRNLSNRVVNSLVVVAVFLGIALASAHAHAQDRSADPTDIQELRNALRTDKRAYIASMLSLTNAEAKRFWPIYDSYQRVIDETSQRRVVALKDLVMRDSPTTNLAAKNVMLDLVNIYDTEAKAHLRLARRMMRALPAVKAARYLQLEDKMLAVRDYDTASAVPLIR